MHSEYYYFVRRGLSKHWYPSAAGSYYFLNNFRIIKPDFAAYLMAGKTSNFLGLMNFIVSMCLKRKLVKRIYRSVDAIN